MIVITKLLSRASDSESCSVVSDSLGPEQNTGVGSHSLLQGMFLTQGLNPDLSHFGQILYYLSHQGSPKNKGVSSHPILQCIFPTQGSHLGLLFCRHILYHIM